MRGLTDEERLLMLAAAGKTGPAFFADSDADVPPAHVVLERRGLLVWVEASDKSDGYEKEDRATPLGELALRCDAAARAAGVWP